MLKPWDRKPHLLGSRTLSADNLPRLGTQAERSVQMLLLRHESSSARNQQPQASRCSGARDESPVQFFRN